MVTKNTKIEPKERHVSVKIIGIIIMIFSIIGIIISILALSFGIVLSTTTADTLFLWISFAFMTAALLASIGMVQYKNWGRIVLIWHSTLVIPKIIIEEMYSATGFGIENATGSILIAILLLIYINRPTIKQSFE